MAVPQVCFKVYETPSGCRGIPQCLSLLSAQTIQIRLSGWQGVAEIPLFSVFWFIPAQRGALGNHRPTEGMAVLWDSGKVSDSASGAY